ncbi:tyrosine recombinase XerC [Saccharothrix longispora]|uniref:site-specific integrase n=1 Tax=Saccharothrix longispora TaxID=33920 RepID=UPI0028FD10B2|nr:tyrosine-type recombinase/integrase [Saccharothrix longispora]MDU0290736.1 tyrosine-type recombinase/integrase [Saccharothrix longispora]
MPRPPLPLGTYGKIRTYQDSAGWRARTKFRDFDGVTRPVDRRGKTQAAAIRALKQALAERTTPVDSDGITPDMRFREAADLWVAEFRRAVEAGRRSPTSLETYENRLHGLVLPAIGELRVRELTVPRLGKVVAAAQDQHSAATAKTVRTVLSGICGLAVRHGALGHNPVRDVERLEGGKRRARALSLDELSELLAKLDTDEAAVRHDLPDLARWYAGTGERTGEGLAVHWHHLDLAAGTVDWGGSLIRVKGQGQRINHGKTDVSERALPLSAWLVDVLRERRAKMAERFGVDQADLRGPVFPNSLGGLRDKHNTLARWREFRARAGYPWVTFRTFRRSVATILDDAGLSARQIADQLGHSKISTTQDVYMARRVTSRKAADALEAVKGFRP